MADRVRYHQQRETGQGDQKVHNRPFTGYPADTVHEYARQAQSEPGVVNIRGTGDTARVYHDKQMGANEWGNRWPDSDSDLSQFNQQEQPRTRVGESAIAGAPEETRVYHNPQMGFEQVETHVGFDQIEVPRTRLDTNADHTEMYHRTGSGWPGMGSGWPGLGSGWPGLFKVEQVYGIEVNSSKSETLKDSAERPDGARFTLSVVTERPVNLEFAIEYTNTTTKKMLAYPSNIVKMVPGKQADLTVRVTQSQLNTIKQFMADAGAGFKAEVVFYAIKGFFGLRRSEIWRGHP